MVNAQLLDFIKLVIDVFNTWFNSNIRESNNSLIHFVWTSSIIFGTIKIIIEIKSCLEFFIRHIYWKLKYDKNQEKIKDRNN